MMQPKPGLSPVGTSGPLGIKDWTYDFHIILCMKLYATFMMKDWFCYCLSILDLYFASEWTHVCKNKPTKHVKNHNIYNKV